MKTLQLRLLVANLLALLTVLTGDIVGSAPLTTVGFAGVFLTLGLLAVLTAATLVGGVAHTPVSMRPTRRKTQ
jgi:hypothetical protein